MKYIRLSVLVLALLGLLAVPASARVENALKQIALTIIAEKFGINLQQAVDFQRVSRLDVFDAAPVYATSYYVRRPVNDVWKLRQQGLGWGQIAQRLGMSPGTFNKLRKLGAFDRDTIWGAVIKTRYGFRDADIAAIRRRGGSIRDVLPACIIAQRSHSKPIVIYQRYQRDRDWYRTAGKHKVDFKKHGKSIRPGGKADDKGRPAQAGKKPGKGNGKGSSAQAGKKSGKGNAKGNSAQAGKKPDKGNGKGQHKGSANGGGKGRGKGPK